VDDAGHRVLAGACGVSQLTTRPLLLLVEQLLLQLGPGVGEQLPDTCLVAAVRLVLDERSCDVQADLLRQVLLRARQIRQLGRCRSSPAAVELLAALLHVVAALLHDRGLRRGLVGGRTGHRCLQSGSGCGPAQRPCGG